MSQSSKCQITDFATRMQMKWEVSQRARFPKWELERGGRKVGGGKYRRDRKREKLNEEKNNKKNKIKRSVLQELMQDRGAEFADKIHARDGAKVLQPMDARLRHFVCRGVIPEGCNAHAKGMRHVVASI